MNVGNYKINMIDKLNTQNLLQRHYVTSDMSYYNSIAS